MDESPGKMYALATVLTILAIVAVALRFYARSLKKVLPSWDDYLVVLALVSTIGTGICMIVGAAIGSLGRRTQLEPDGMPVFDRRMEVFFRILYISQLTQTVTFGLTKLAVVLFYRRVFTTRTFSIISWVMIGLTITWTIAFFAANLLQCSPVSANWTSLDAATGACIDTTMMYLAEAYSDVFTDVLIISMPLAWIWKLQMAPMRKFFVVLMFQLGAIVVGAGVAKLVVFHRIVHDLVVEHRVFHKTAAGDEVLGYILAPTVYWPMVESSLGIVGACLPLLRPIFTDTPAKNLFSVLRAVISPSSLRSSNAHSSCQEFAKLEAGNARPPENHPFEELEM